jgi:hypothetical protein
VRVCDISVHLTASRRKDGNDAKQAPPRDKPLFHISELQIERTATVAPGIATSLLRKAARILILDRLCCRCTCCFRILRMNFKTGPSPSTADLERCLVAFRASPGSNSRVQAAETLVEHVNMRVKAQPVGKFSYSGFKYDRSSTPDANSHFGSAKEVRTEFHPYFIAFR